MTDAVFGYLALGALFVGMFAYIMLDRWCDHQETMRGKK